MWLHCYFLHFLIDTLLTDIFSSLPVLFYGFLLSHTGFISYLGPLIFWTNRIYTKLILRKCYDQVFKVLLDFASPYSILLVGHYRTECSISFHITRVKIHLVYFDFSDWCWSWVTVPSGLHSVYHCLKLWQYADC